MKFNWINWGNLGIVVCLIVINIIAFRRGTAENLRSRSRAINICEQIGRYGCIIFMIFPVFTKNWEFGFLSVMDMFIWGLASIFLLILYGLLWLRKSHGGNSVFGLATVPVLLFLLNGILLRHFLLIAAALVFGISHWTLIKENS